MGEAKRKASATAKFIKANPICAFCGQPSETREHCPPRACFDNKHRPDDMIIPACQQCNSGTSGCDLIASLFARLGWSHQNSSSDERVKYASAIRRNFPEVYDEWFRHPMKARSRIRHWFARRGIIPDQQFEGITLGPNTIKLLHQFAHKLTFALYFQTTNETLPPNGGVYAAFRSKEQVFSRDDLSNFLDQHLGAYESLQQGSWTTRSTFRYRTSWNNDDGSFMCDAIFRDAFSVFGLAVRDKEKLPREETPEHFLPGRLLVNVPNIAAFEAAIPFKNEN